LKFIIFNLAGVTHADQELRLLRSAFPDVRIIVELDGDDPGKAFQMLRLGAFVVVSSRITKTVSLWDIITKAIGNKTPYGALMSVKRWQSKQPPKQWGFMSMTFNPGDQNHIDYDLGICPAMRELGLEVQRVDDIRYTGPPDMRKKIKDAIARRPVVLAQTSSYTANTMYEIGLADAWGKTIILLRRTTGEPIPAVLKGLLYVDYSTLTELAMKLFFGLGGLPAVLKKRSAKASHS
jgi:hypothetical protein